MTQEEFQKIPFRFVSSLAMEDEHTITYWNNEYRIGICKHTKKNAYGEFGRSYTHYQYLGKTYKSLPKFLEAIKDVPVIQPDQTTESGCRVIDIRTKTSLKN